MAKEKPGVMVYWETFDVLESLVDGDAKIMMAAIRQYSQYGVLPDFTGNAILATLWLLIRPKLDADSERYEKIREQRREAVNSRWEKERKKTTSEYGSIQPYSKDTGEYGSIRNIPTTTTTASTTTYPTANPETNPTAEPEEGIRDNEEREKGRTLTSPPQCPPSDNSDYDFEELRRQRIEALNATFDRR